MKHLILCLLVTMLTVAQSQTTNYSKSGKVKIVSSSTIVKDTIIQVDTISIIDKKNLSQYALDGDFSEAPASSLNLISSILTDELAQEVKRYESSFGGTCSGSGIYNNEKISIPKLTISRYVIEKGDTKEKLAAKLVLVPVMSPDGTAFRYRVDNNSEYIYSTAKIRGKYKYIDSEITIKLTVTTQSNKGRKVEELRTTKITVPGIKVGDKFNSGDYYSGWIPMPSISTTQTEEPCDSKDPKCKDGSKTIEKPIEGVTGLFEVEVTVKESSIYKAKAESRKSRYEAIAQPLIDLLSPLILLSPAK